MIHLQLFWEFLKTGLFGVGGGLATIPFIYAISDSLGWISHAQIADMIAVAESTPGPIAINIATYTGFHVAGLTGSALATLGYVLPSIVIISVISRFMKKFKESEVVTAVFAGLRPAATGLIAAAAFSVIKLGLFNPGHKGYTDFIKWRELILFVALFVLIRKFKWHPVLYIAVAGVIGVVFNFQTH